MQIKKCIEADLSDNRSTNWALVFEGSEYFDRLPMEAEEAVEEDIKLLREVSDLTELRWGTGVITWTDLENASSEAER